MRRAASPPKRVRAATVSRLANHPSFPEKLPHCQKSFPGLSDAKGRRL